MTGQQPPPHHAAGADGPDQRWRVAALCLALAAMTFVVFGQTTGFGFINFDDDTYVYGNAVVAGGLSLKGMAWVFTHADCSLYHPLTMLSLMADYQLHGLHAGGYHLTNVLLHTASVILLFLVLRQMTGALWRSAFVAAVFAIHPLRVESVAWVGERKDVLAGLFFMLTLGAYVHYVRNPKSAARYLMVAVAFVLALLSKPTVVTLPFVLLLLDYWPLQRAEPRKLSRLVLEKLPLLALAAGACAATVLAAGKEIAIRANISLSARIANALVSCAVYLRQMVWPATLAAFYPQPEKGYPFWTIALSLLLLALVTGGVLAFGRKRRWLLTGWLWYLGMLTPMIGLVQAGPFAHADRITYLPQIGIYVALTWLVAGWDVKPGLAAALMTGIIAALMICAWQQTAYWRDSETLWTHTLACTADNGLAHNNLGTALRQKGKVDDAIVQYQEALETMPDNESVHVNLANAFLRKREMAQAIAQFQTALQIEPADMEVQNNLAWLLATCAQASLRNGDKAVQLARQANELAGGKNPVVLGTLAAALAEAGQFSEAARNAREAMALAQAVGQASLVRKLSGELQFYEAGRPLHQP
jgi:tetratricopeptide (TPR) repeat protein